MLFHQFIMSTIEIYVTQVSINKKKKQNKFVPYWMRYLHECYLQRFTMWENVKNTKNTCMCI